VGETGGHRSERGEALAVSARSPSAGRSRGPIRNVARVAKWLYGPRAGAVAGRPAAPGHRATPFGDPRSVLGIKAQGSWPARPLEPLKPREVVGFCSARELASSTGPRVRPGGSTAQSRPCAVTPAPDVGQSAGFRANQQRRRGFSGVGARAERNCPIAQPGVQCLWAERRGCDVRVRRRGRRLVLVDEVWRDRPDVDLAAEVIQLLVGVT
jgi:hypothetical protein